MVFHCKYCNYNTERRGDYKKHFSSLKHHKNKKKAVEKYQKRLKKDESVVVAISGVVTILEKPVMNYQSDGVVFECNCLCYKTEDRSNLNKHLKSKKHQNCLEIANKVRAEYTGKFSSIIKFLKSELKKKDEMLKEKGEMLKEKDKMLKEKDKMLKEKEKEIEENYINGLEKENKLLHEVKDICKKSAKSAYQIIINSYNEAPNFTSLPLENMSQNDFNRYMRKGIPNGIIEMIEDCYVKDIPKEKRSLWCLDPSRVKYLIRKDNDWSIDNMGREIKKAIMPPIRQKFITELNSIDDDNYCKMMNCMNLASDMDKKKKQSQIIKEASNIFVHKD